MTEIRITIRTANAAFADDDGAIAVSRILSELSARVAQWDGNIDNWSPDAIPLRDVNGNRVGQLEVVDS